VPGPARFQAPGTIKLLTERLREANLSPKSNHMVNIGWAVDYTVGSSFIFKQGGSTKTFTAAEITTDQTGLGTLVSVPLLLMIDTDGSLIWQMPAEGMGHGICNALAVNNP
jgi:hypothetical protein